MIFNRKQTKRLLNVGKFIEGVYDGRYISCYPPHVYMAAADCYGDIVRTGMAETFITNVADLFRQYGFKIGLDDSGINYLIRA